MKHLGDITKINGAEIPVVDVICGGSPCQDLSVAGKRAGLDGERSGLFMEQVRVIKEMREHDRCTGRPDEYLRPRYMVWENVPGAFSSGTPKGEDFRIVLEETAKISQGDAAIPRPEGGWTAKGNCTRMRIPQSTRQSATQLRLGMTTGRAVSGVGWQDGSVPSMNIR